MPARVPRDGKDWETRPSGVRLHAMRWARRTFTGSLGGTTTASASTRATTDKTLLTLHMRSSPLLPRAQSVRSWASTILTAAAMMAALVLCATFATWEQIAKIVHRRPPFLQRTTRSTFASSGAAYQTSSHGTESAFLRLLRACQLACQLACVLACIKRPP